MLGDGELAYMPRTGLRAYREDISAHTESVSALSV